ncbi:MAG: Nif11-like leader peptide family RiPP precursor [Lachnospiraceae bacterium]|nr:Nif11-like leader peptide family RiPP precursor [Lachnospiraceae bacterium]MBO6146172.1 Nif11-like leader peptide family RiPP precursor [Lachnospiraceae bacterium]
MRTKEELEALQAKLKEVMADKTFAEKLLSLEEPEDVKKALEEKGVSLTLDEIRQMAEDAIREDEGDGELFEDELDMVAGGGFTKIHVSKGGPRW